MKNSPCLLLVALFFLSFSLVAQPVKETGIFAANKLLAKTINLGFTFDAPKEGEWGNTFTAKEIADIKNAGFTAIRLPVQWIARMDSTAPYNIDKAFLARIDLVVGQAVKNKLAIIIENCLDEQLMAAPEKYKARFLSLWQQVAAHFAASPPQVMFEIMAEPHGELSNVWEQYYTDPLAIIRKNNKERPVIIGAGFFNSPQNLTMLHLPENDRYLIATIHLYLPIKFTMQGEQWFPFGKPMEWLGTSWTGTAAEQKEITGAMDQAASWGVANNRPIFMGEFGVTDHAAADSRKRYLQFNRQQAEQRNFSWGVWSFNVNFSIYDNKAAAWRTDLLTALMSKTEPPIAIKTDPSPQAGSTSITPDEILKKAVAAQGGATAIAAIKDISLTGNAFIGGQQVEVEEKYLPPAAFCQIMKMGDKVMRKTAVSDTSFTMTFQGNNMPIDNGDKESLKEKASYFLESYLLVQKGYTYLVKGTEKVDSSDAYVLEIKTPGGRTMMSYYDVQTGLKVKMVADQQTPQGRHTVQTFYKSYKAFNGVLLPTTLLVSLGSFDIEMKYGDIKVNTGLSARAIN